MDCQAHELQVFNCKIPSTFHCAWQLILSLQRFTCCQPKVVKFDILAGSEICVFKAENFKYKFQGARQRFLRFAVFYTRFGEKSKNYCQAHEIHILQCLGRPLESTCRQ